MEWRRIDVRREGSGGEYKREERGVEWRSIDVRREGSGVEENRCEKEYGIRHGRIGEGVE